MWKFFCKIKLLKQCIFSLGKRGSIEVLRRRIDKVDDEMHKLLLKRTLLVKNIGRTKSTSVGLTIRPSREAHIHRRLLKNHTGDFPFSSLMGMWREIIAASTLLQADYRLAVYAPANDRRCWEIARNHFGSVVEIAPSDTIRETVEKAEKSAKTIAIIPAQGLHMLRNTHVILRLPFLGKVSTPYGVYDAFAIAQLEPQNSEDDIIVYKGKILPPGAEEILKQDGLVFYTGEKNWKTQSMMRDDVAVIGCYPKRIGE